MNGENLQSLHKNLEAIRFVSVSLLLIHFYCACHPAMQQWHLTHHFVDTLIFRLSTGLFILSGLTVPKLTVLFFLWLSQIGEKGKKETTITLQPVLVTFFGGLLLYFASVVLLDALSDTYKSAVAYITVTLTGYLLILFSGARLSRLLTTQLGRDPFNVLSESFPQEERLLENEYSVNLPAKYMLKGVTRKSWINFINPFRGILVLGTPGAGKSVFVVRHIIIQHIKKGFTIYLYDFKFPDLTIIAYNTVLKNMNKYPVPPKLYIVNFDDLSRSHRCNILTPEYMHDLTDATESSRTIMLALNRQWLKRQGEFFTESPINFVTALIWFLKKYQNGRYCTLPHVIELAQIEYEKLFVVLAALEPEVDVLINPFTSALTRGASEQLEGQVASAKIGLARLVSPNLYYILTGNDFTLDINEPDHPKIVCVGNNPAKTSVYGAVLSLCTERMLKLVNRKGKLKSSLIFDEYPTLVCDLSVHVATARSNRSSTTFAIQDISQVRKEYGREQADVLMNISGNIISGQVLGDTAKLLSERLGRIMQERESISINSNDTSVSLSNQLENALQPSKIANLSSGEFVGAVADDPMQKIPQKTFHSQIQNDFEAIAQEESMYEPIPVLRHVTPDMPQQVFFQVRNEVRDFIEMEFLRIEKLAGRMTA